MVVFYILPHAEFGSNDHQKDAPNFTFSALDFSDEDMKRRERLEREEIELKKKKLKEKEEIIRLLKEKEAEVERLSREEEMAYAAREAAREAKLNRELTNQMLAEADKLLEETAAFQRARKMESNEVVEIKV